jgi:uncharacterized protein YggE
MKRRVGPGLACAVALSLLVIATTGCTTKVVTAPAAEPLNAVTASGTGKVAGSPDEAGMSFGVTRSASSAKTALAQVSAVATKITAALVKSGIAEVDIRTANLSVYPQYDNSARPAITGYRASLSVEAKVRDIGTLGDVINAANGAGADTISGPSFTISEDSKYTVEAIGKAVADARKNAEAMAKAAGKTVGDVISISDTGVTVPPGPLYYDSAAMGAKASAGVPISPGQLDVSASVTVVFELK